ncbi:MFS transporter [Bosea robiniae]|jgi:DHA2 family multidrug resistance protein-like MFS transporter|uniref:MFS transporter, DHA2 family, multidrug resistance protein n=1 Tax=Bosea robiniae TaxID=1036780 RepID=A0ABY0NMW5_9HYPH|nr:MFS transporter [Bosea robiniae]SDF81408.1 MFS transporter, DHA2 family, multidrug resistance protein [Bosea robiniae]
MLQPALDPHADGLPAPRRYFAIAVLLLSLVLVVLDGAIANIALPSIAASLHASPGDAVWVVSSYQLAVLVALLPCGAIGEMVGPRRVFLAGVALFTLASAACAVSSTLPMLMAARFVQGLGGGAVMALGVTNLRLCVPHRLLGTIIGINAMTIAIASAAGPGIAGAILAVANWPRLFAVNVPLGIVVLAAGAVLVRTTRVARRLDGRAIAVNSLMFVLFFLGADRVAQSPITGGLLIVASVACFALLRRIERRSAAPLVPTDLFAAPAFRFSVIASVCCFTGQMLGLLALPFYLQHGLDMMATQAGLYMMAWPAAVALIAPISGWLAHRVKTAWLCAAGGFLLALGLAGVGLLPAGPHGATFIVSTVMAGLGFGLFQTPNNRVLLLSAPKARSGAAGAMQGTARLTGQTLGSVAMAAIFEVAPPPVAPEIALVLAAAFASLSALVSLGRVRHEITG